MDDDVLVGVSILSATCRRNRSQLDKVSWDLDISSKEITSFCAYLQNITRVIAKPVLCSVTPRCLYPTGGYGYGIAAGTPPSTLTRREIPIPIASYPSRGMPYVLLVPFLL